MDALVRLKWELMNIGNCTLLGMIISIGSHEIFPPTKINAYGDMVLCESMMMGVAINIVAVWPTFSKQ